MSGLLRLALMGALIFSSTRAVGLEPVGDKLVVLTFDDAVKTHYTIVRPILKQHGFGATFFVTEGFDFRTNKEQYLTWEEIAQLHRDGFEIGNHTRDHLTITEDNVAQLKEQLEAIDEQCRAHGIPRPITFAWPGNRFSAAALPLLAEHGIQFARRGGQPEYDYGQGRGFAYEPGLDHPLLIPSAGDARPDWTFEDFRRAVEQARGGRIAVLQFHGVPDREHPWVSTEAEQFAQFMQYLADEGYRVIGLRDLARYVDPNNRPLDWQGVLHDRRQHPERSSARPPDSEAELRYWLKNMAAHQFQPWEMAAATGRSTAEIAELLERCNIRLGEWPKELSRSKPFSILPYPGGRHPRIGFLDGAIRPHRETKFSAFAPWDEHSYVVVDVPEAIWCDTQQGRELLYLAHTHVPTLWEKQGIALEPREWQRLEDGSLVHERKLPNKVLFGARVTPGPDRIEMELWITNHSDRTLTGLTVQNCVMLKAAAGFTQQTNDNKLFRSSVAAARHESGERWILTSWERCVRAWGNQHCPCLHSDPQFPDCAPGETQRLRGWLAFYEGTDVERFLEREEE